MFDQNETIGSESLGLSDGEAYDIVLHMDGGDIRSRLHFADSTDSAVLWVFGAGGGLGGPAGGVYERLAEQLLPLGVTSLQVDYRHPAHLEPCVADVLQGVEFLQMLGKERVVLVGHSFGGAVVISTGAVSGDEVIGVVAMSSQSYGTGSVAALSPKPLLLIHGEADEILPASCSHDILRRASEPKKLILYPDCRHGLDQCRDDLDRDLHDFLKSTLGVGYDGVPAVQTGIAFSR